MSQATTELGSLQAAMELLCRIEAWSAFAAHGEFTAAPSMRISARAVV